MSLSHLISLIIHSLTLVPTCGIKVFPNSRCIKQLTHYFHEKCMRMSCCCFYFYIINATEQTWHLLLNWSNSSCWFVDEFQSALSGSCTFTTYRKNHEQLRVTKMLCHSTHKQLDVVFWWLITICCYVLTFSLKKWAPLVCHLGFLQFKLFSLILYAMHDCDYVTR